MSYERVPLGRRKNNATKLNKLKAAFPEKPARKQQATSTPTETAKMIAIQF
jgi:hypothetical protein